MLIFKTKNIRMEILRRKFTYIKQAGETVRMSTNGTFTLNAGACDLLELDDENVDGIQFGIDGFKLYIAYCNDEDRYIPKTRIGEHTRRFKSVDEQSKILELFNLEKNEVHLFDISDTDFTFHNNTKFHRLIKSQIS